VSRPILKRAYKPIRHVVCAGALGRDLLVNLRPTGNDIKILFLAQPIMLTVRPRITKREFITNHTYRKHHQSHFVAAFTKLIRSVC